MGIFSRFRDIVSSNINAMLDRAEDPEKLIKLMKQEMEDTLVELKASCAGAMATRKKIERGLAEARDKVVEWAVRAEMAVTKGREDLAREALLEKRLLAERVEGLERELGHAQALIEEYQSDIVQLEEKLSALQEKERVLRERHIHAQHKRRAQEELRRADTAEVMARFERFENRVERMEAEAELVNYGRKTSLEAEFQKLKDDEEIERELADLKAKAGK